MELLLASLLWGLPVLVLTALAVLCGLWWSLSYGHLSIYNGRLSTKPVNLPPGTMGWPIIGETFEYLNNFKAFISARSSRYGEIYKTHLEGRATIVTTSPGAYRFIMSTNPEEFQPLYSSAIVRTLGPRFLNFLSGSVHTRLRKVLHSHLINVEALKQKIGGIEELALLTLDAWAPETTLPAFRFAIEDYTLSVGMFVVFGSEARLPEVRALQAEYSELERGFTTIIPVDLPGTQWSKSVKSRRKVANTLTKLIKRRQAKGINKHQPDGLLDSFLSDTDRSQGDLLDWDTMSDNVIGVLFASNATAATAITWMLKLLRDFPEHLTAVKAEHDNIRSRKSEHESLTMDDIKDMAFTSMAFQEALRISSLIDPVVTREAAQDVVYKGFVIPKGWRVKPMHMYFHMDNRLWPEPEKFNPNRFESPRGNLYAPFGAGEHLCPGSDFAKLEILIFLHHLITKFRWEVLQDGPTDRLPFSAPYKGLPVRLTRIDSDNAPLVRV